MTRSFGAITCAFSPLVTSRGRQDQAGANVPMWSKCKRTMLHANETKRPVADLVRSLTHRDSHTIQPAQWWAWWGRKEDGRQVGRVCGKEWEEIWGDHSSKESQWRCVQVSLTEPANYLQQYRVYIVAGVSWPILLRSALFVTRVLKRCHRPLLFSQ